jgi:ankyrin repeat protein
MTDKEEKVDIMERKGKDLYKMILDYTKRHRRPVDKKRIEDQIKMGFFYTDRTYGMFDDTLLTTALNEDLEDVALELAKYGQRSNLGHLNAEGNYPLLLACKKKYKDVVFELLKHKGNPCVPDENGETPLSYAVSDINMLDVVKQLIKKKLCDGNYKKEMMRILEVRNFEAFELLIDIPELELESYVYESDATLTLLEYIYISDLGPNYSENHKYAEALLKKTKSGCHPLHMNKKHKISALLFACGDMGSNIETTLYVIKELLKYADEEGNRHYVDFKSQTGHAAFDLIFQNALADGTAVDIRILKLFIDFYYKNNPSSRVFLRNIPLMCEEPELFRALKNLFPESDRHLLDNACEDIVSASATLSNPLEKTPSPEIQKGNRVGNNSFLMQFVPKMPHAEDADEIPIVHAESPVSPLPLWAQVGDPLERGVRQTKRVSPTRGGKTRRKGVKRRKVKRN